MGGGVYSSANAAETRATLGYHTKSNEQIFISRSLDGEMSPHGVTLRESRDSEEHPDSLAIILGLDLTGSMGSIPQMLVRDGLPNIMSKIIQNGEPDPQLLFLGIGDHECDRAPLQLGQFESNDEMLDKWLTTTYLEGGGGGNRGESYLLAWYFAAMHTSIDCHEKRGRKGLLFTIGDEPTLRNLPASSLKRIMGDGQYGDCTASDLLEQARERYDVYHIHLLSTGTGARFKDEGSWEQLLGSNLIMAQSPDEVASIVVDITSSHEGGSSPANVIHEEENTQQSEDDEVIL